MNEYSGHRSWNAWNVSLWIGNDEGLYRFALQCIQDARDDKARIAALFRDKGRTEDYIKIRCRHMDGDSYALDKGTRYFMRDMGQTRTPDGAIYNNLSVRLALAGLME